MIWVDKKIDADPKAIRQIEFVEQLIKLDNNATDANNDQSMFVFNDVRKNQREEIKIFLMDV